MMKRDVEGLARHGVVPAARTRVRVQSALHATPTARRPGKVCRKCSRIAGARVVARICKHGLTTCLHGCSGCLFRAIERQG